MAGVFHMGKHRRVEVENLAQLVKSRRIVVGAASIALKAEAPQLNLV